MNVHKIRISQILDAFWILAIAVVYYWSAQLGFLFAWKNSNVSAVWIPSALGFTAIFFLGYRLWPAIWLGAFLANATYFLSNPSLGFAQTVLFSTLIGIGNTLEAVAVCFVLKKLIGHRNPLHKAQDILRFMMAAMSGCAISAFVGALTGCLSNPSFWNLYAMIWSTWWLGDISGILILTPVFWALGQRPFPKANARRITEFVISLSILIFVEWMIFSGKSIIGQTHIPITYLSLPLMVWLTYRFDYWGAIISILVTLPITVYGTKLGFGPFIGADASGSLVLLQTFIVTACGTNLLLAAALYERRQAQQEVVLREQRFRALVENSLDMITLVNLIGIISYCSPSTAKVMGYQPEDYLGKSMFDFVHPEDEPGTILKFSHILSHPGEVVNIVLRVRHKNGSWRWIEADGQNLLADPAIGTIVINHRDITQRKQAEEVLKNELKQAARLADLGTLAAIVAHELRTPLGVIQVASHNLKHKNKELAQDKHLDNIQKKVWEGNRIIDNLLSYSRIKIPSYEPCAILTLLEECVLNIQNQFKELEVAVQKNYQISDDFVIEADSNQIREVLVNVLDNAYQAMKDKSGRIELTVQKRDNEYVEISIKDNGVGIDAEDLDKIFLPFYTTKAKGTGLGLSICNELVNLHHGHFEIQSIKDHGTTVHIVLPVHCKAPRSNNK
ncbi:MAG: MASE1 domain-containing protein [Candidatus Omnitrophica bacterium]|nr:MASE1 domain-containing protein [Candidatus Omnitrophota bacterium]